MSCFLLSFSQLQYHTNRHIYLNYLCRSINRTTWKDKLISDVRACVAGCNDDIPVCLIIADHSQGGGIATTASLQLADITPKYEVITYAAPPALTVEPETCSPQMNFRVHYRFGKALYKDSITGGARGLVFDKVSFLGPDPVGLLIYSVGEFIILSSEDTQNVAHVGYNTELVLRPWDDWPIPLGKAHNLYSESHETGYLSIVQNILDKDSFPVGVSGFENNMHCGNQYDSSLLCASDRCDRAHGELHRTCKSKLINGKPCNSDMDCISGRCPSTFRSKCKDKAGAGEKCANNNDCIDGYYCPAGLFRKCKAETQSFGVDEPITTPESSATVQRLNIMTKSIPYFLVVAFPYFLN